MTGIQWTDCTWNVVRGCSRVSAGCTNCYAERQAARFAGTGQPYEGLVTVQSVVSGLRYNNPKAAGAWTTPRWSGQVRFVAEKLSEPLRWRKPRRVFVNSMSDLFHESLSNEEVAAVFGVMAACPQHTFQVLTKRPERMREWFEWLNGFRSDPHGDWDPRTWKCAHEAERTREVSNVDFASPWPLPNVWLGVSVEDQKTADERIPLLLETPAAVRFVSAEPLLGPTNLSRWLGYSDTWDRYVGPCGCDERRDPWDRCEKCDRSGWEPAPLSGVSWIIVGGESGRGARPCAIEWVESIVAQCKTASIPMFVKQLGSLQCDGRFTVKVAGKGADPSEWPEHLRVREFPVMEDEAGAKLNGSGQ